MPTPPPNPPGLNFPQVFSVDWMPDTHGNLWMFEMNLSPAVLKRDKAYDAGGYDARREWLQSHDEEMLKEALDIVLPWGGGEGQGEWELVGEFAGGGGWAADPIFCVSAFEALRLRPSQLPMPLRSSSRRNVRTR